jgi:hypothetical protein
LHNTLLNFPSFRLIVLVISLFLLKHHIYVSFFFVSFSQFTQTIKFKEDRRIFVFVKKIRSKTSAEERSAFF